MPEDTQEDIKEKIEAFLNLTEKDTNHRYWSWNHCYLFFRNFYQKARQLGRSIPGRDIDLACLNLAFYLASWGMYRGSSFLLWKDYKIFEPIIENLIKPEFDELWSTEYYERLLRSEEIITKGAHEINKVFRLKKAIQDSFKNMKVLKGPLKGTKEKENLAHPTVTLITKILLGTMACVPAYDNYFKAGLREKDVTPFSSFTPKSLAAILEFCKTKDACLNRIKIAIRDSEGRKTHYYYPLMKLVDMYFWEVGSEKQEKLKNKW